jgi:hypothetical protein
MLPGFTGLVPLDTRPNADANSESVYLAGLWDTPSPEICTYARTDTFCTGLVLWCKEVYVCRDPKNPIFGHEESRTPYPCGVCVGVTDPSDW